MTQYRAKIQFVTSGAATLHLKTGWVSHRDMVEEAVDSLRPFENKRGRFVGYEIEQKCSVREGENE